MFILFKEIICGMQDFSIFMRLFPNLMTIQGPNLIKGKGIKKLEKLKHLSLKKQEAMSKKVAITEKKKTICQTNQLYQSVAFNCKIYP